MALREGGVVGIDADAVSLGTLSLKGDPVVIGGDGGTGSVQVTSPTVFENSVTFIGRQNSIGIAGSVIPFQTLNSGLPVSGTFVSCGGRHLILASLSGFSSASQQMVVPITDIQLSEPGSPKVVDSHDVALQQPGWTRGAAVGDVCRDLSAGTHKLEFISFATFSANAADTAELTVLEIH